METYESSVTAEQLERALNKSVFSVNGKTGDVSLGASDVKAVPLPSVAEVGQTIVVTAVDENGVPTAWEAADMAAGGDKWKLINTIAVADDATTSVTFSTDSNGNEFALKKILVKVTGIKGAATYMSLRLNGLSWMHQFASAGTGSANYTESSPITIKFQILGDGIYECNSVPSNRQVRVDGDATPDGAIQSHIENVTQIHVLWGTGAALTNGAVFTLYGVRA